MAIDTINNPQNSDLRTGIAVIGMSGRFPGSNNLDEFWQNLVDCRDTIHTFSDTELIQAGIPKELIANPYYIKRRGILNNIEYFDADLFKMTPTQAAIMDPQHRLFMEICLEALDHAGYRDRSKPLFAGVFAGMSDSEYRSNFLLKNNNFFQTYDPFQTHIATSGHFLATKVSYHLNLTGPSINIQTACSTSLVAVIKACQALDADECDLALAGGVTIRVPQARGYLYQEGGILSQDGKCRAFDRNSNGTVSSNGLGVVVLKRLQDAMRDRDAIDAIIVGYGLNNDGSTKNGYTAPSIQGQSQCIAIALQGVDPESISYIETHGTGTLLGDPIEITALTKAFRQHTDKKNFCAIGSVKTNIGHTDTASGIAGFIKTVLALKNKIIPASLYFSEKNPYIDFESSPFYVQKETTEWEANGANRRAGVSSFGIGGTNAHVILQDASDLQDSISHLNISQNRSYHRKKYWIEPDVGQNNQTQTMQPNYPYSKQLDFRLGAPGVYTLVQEDVSDENNNAENSSAKSIYLPYWEVSSLETNASLSLKKSWMIFANDVPLVKKFIKQLITEKQDVCCIYTGNQFQKNDNGYYLNHKSKIEYNKLLQSLSENKKRFDYVVYFWSAVEKNNFTPENYFDSKYLEEQLMSLAYFCQIFFKHMKHQMNLMVVSNQSQKVLANDLIIPEHASLIAPCLTIPQEYVNVTCKLIDIELTDDQNYNSLVHNLICEANCRLDNLDNLIAYRRGIRFTKRYKNKLIEATSKKNIFKKNGTYFIIGASGKIGVRLAYYLANHFSAHLILMSRKKIAGNFFESTKEDDRIIWEKIRKNASSVKLITADLNNDVQIDHAIDEIKKSYHQIDGIFHLAAAINYANVKTLIADIDTRQILDQIIPKISGVKMAIKIAKIISTDFCCLFSSISNILGGIGLTSYIAGNVYLDSIAEIYSKQLDFRLGLGVEKRAPGVYTLVQEDASDEDNNAENSSAKSIYKNSNMRLFSLNLDAIEVEENSKRLINHKDTVNRSKLNIAHVLPLISKFSMDNTDGSPIIIVSALPLTERIKRFNYHKLNMFVKENGEKNKSIKTMANEDKFLVKNIEDIFKLCLGIKHIEHSKSFYKLGGDSVDAIRLLELLEKQFHVRLTLNELTTYSSIEKLTEFLTNKNSLEMISHVVKLNQFFENLPTLFLIHPIGGTSFCYLKLADLLVGKINCYGIQDSSLNTMDFQFNSIEEMAEKYLNDILEINSTVDFYMGGFSFGSSLAFEMARQLEERGKKAKPVIIIDGWAAFSDELASYQKFKDRMKLTLDEIKNNLLTKNIDEKGFINLAWRRAKILFQYRPPTTDIPILLFKATKLLPEYASVDDPTNYWKFHTRNRLKIYSIPGNHNDILRSDCVKEIAKITEELICDKSEL
jgi:acyl transferase domain-containing protein/thioesterase domain-containing protein/acyl carrier protein